MLFLVAIVSIVVHFIFFGYPHQVVFDEVHASNFISNYWHGTYFFDVHPPLAKMIEALFGYIVGANNYLFDYTTIGNHMPGHMVLLRIIPAICGTLLPFIIYFILRKLDISKVSSFAVAILLCFENSLIIQSRFILFDMFLITFGFLSILFYLFAKKRKSKDKKYWWLIIISAFFAGCSFSVKWTGLGFALTIFLFELYELLASRISREKIYKTFSIYGIYACVIGVLYVSLFALHFAVLPYSGYGNLYMSPQFQATLSGNDYSNQIVKEGFVGKFLELNTVMFTANLTLTETQTYSSKWYTWPIMEHSIFYWTGDSKENGGEPDAYIYLIGNPFIYWLGSACVFAFLAFILIKKMLAKNLIVEEYKKRAVYFILFGFLANFLPFIFIGRIMFLYHYEAALVWSIMSIGLLIEFIPINRRKVVAGFIVALSVAFFLYFSPITYGTKLSIDSLNQRMWSSDWR